MLQTLIAPVASLLDKFIPDADTKQKIAHEIATMSEKHAQELAKGQLEINKEEAKHRSLFVAGWRPFLGWILAAAMGWHFVFAPATMFFCSYLGVTIPELPMFDICLLYTSPSPRDGLLSRMPSSA